MTILEAASLAGIEIPAMCHNSDAGHFASCMVCIVRERNGTALIPSCSARVREGMDIVTGDRDIEEARKTALELLLSEHTGDCEAPCRIACPANMDIPLMNSFLAGGMPDRALEVVMRDIAMPSVLGRICPAPCEGACHRKNIDSPVSVCVLKRFAGDAGHPDIAPAPASSTSSATDNNKKIADSSSHPAGRTSPRPVGGKEGTDISASRAGHLTAPPAGGKTVAIIGAGIAGLSAAYYLQKAGLACTIYDNNPEPGGALRYEIDDERLDRETLDRETGMIIGTGARFVPSAAIDKNRFIELVYSSDAVVVATGNLSAETADWGLDHNGKQLLVNKNSLQTSIPNVFAAGNITRSSKLAIRSAAQGKEVAFSIMQFLGGHEPIGEPKLFNSRVGRLRDTEYGVYMTNISREKRIGPSGKDGGFTPEEVVREASRCMHCECLKPDSCTLRILAGRYGASQRRFGFEERKPVRRSFDHEHLVYESGKCIKCGICVRLSAKNGEDPGLTFIGRGYDVEIAVPFEESLDRALKNAGPEIARACPTGALSMKPDKTGMSKPGPLKTDE